METKVSSIEPLIERVEAYGKTSFELLRLKSVEKTTDLASTLVSRSLFTLVVSIFAFIINIAVALWLGDLLGKTYYGFLIVAACYGLAGLVLWIMHSFIKNRVNDTFIRQLLK